MSELFTIGSVCSGIEAASVALIPLGFKPIWLSEIEPAPCSVLAHHYPDVPNLGDMKKIAALIRDCFVPAPDMLCGGTPCQAFSIAGLRNSLDDDRGNLSLVFCEIADEIDKRRAADGLLPAVIVWENVPGVLSTSDNAFGCFLAGLAGENDPIEPPGAKWSNAGCVYGPKRTVAWRVFDAQYFGVAQRRRRVFVVASAREGFDPAAVLFEFDGVRRDSAPSRETGQDVTGSLTSSAGRRGGVDDPERGTMIPVAPALRQWLNAGGMGRQDWETETMVVDVCPTLRAGGNSTGGDRPPGTDVDTADSLIALSVALRGRDGGATAELGGEVAGTQRASSGGGDKAHVLAPIAFSSKDYGGDAMVDLSPTLRAGNHDKSHANAGSPPAVCITGDITHTLKAEGFDASEDGTGRGQPIVPAMAFAQNTRDEVRLVGGDSEICGALSAQPGMKQTTYVAPGMAVRRLTPIECHRLQGFPDTIKSVTLQICSTDHQKKNALAEIQNLKSPNNVSNAAEKPLAQYAETAMQSSSTKQDGPAKHVVLRVRQHYGILEAKLLSQEKSPLNASIAELSNWFPLASPKGDFAQLFALTLTELGHSHLLGKVELLGSASHLIHHQHGEKPFTLCGEEIAGYAKDAAATMKIASQLLTSITSQAGRLSKNYESNLQTLSCYVAAVIAGCIPSEIPLGSISELNLELRSHYLTQVLVRGKPMADGPMYKALGNSWAVPNVVWIGRRIHSMLTRGCV